MGEHLVHCVSQRMDELGKHAVGSCVQPGDELYEAVEGVPVRE